MATSGSKIGPKPKRRFGTYSTKSENFQNLKIFKIFHFFQKIEIFTDIPLLISKDFDGLGYQITRSHGGKSKIAAVQFLEYVWRARGFNGNLWVEDRPET